MAHRRREALLSTEAESATTEVNQMKSSHEGGSILRMHRHAGLAVPGHTHSCLLPQDLCLLSCQSASLPWPVRPPLNTPEANGLEYTPAGSGPSVIGEEGECVCRRPPLFFTPLFPWECVSHRAWRLLSLARLRVSKSWRSSCLLSSSPAGKLEACAATLRFFYWCWRSALRSSWMHSKHPYHCPAPRSRTVTSRQHSRETGYKHGPIGKWGCVEGTASLRLKFQIADKAVASGCPSGCSLWLKRGRKWLHHFPVLPSHPLIMSSAF